MTLLIHSSYFIIVWMLAIYFLAQRWEMFALPMSLLFRTYCLGAKTEGEVSIWTVIWFVNDLHFPTVPLLRNFIFSHYVRLTSLTVVWEMGY